MVKINVLAAVLCCLGFPAAAEPVESFLKFCVASDGVEAGARDRALDSGWQLAPPRIQEAFAKGPGTHVQVYSSLPEAATYPETVEFLVIGGAPGTVQSGAASSAPTSFCSITAKIDSSHVFEKLQAGLGFSPVETQGRTLFLYSRGADGLRSEGGLASLPSQSFFESARDRQIQMIQFQPAAASSTLVLIPLRPPA